ncbi:MAG: hypothetical protein LBD42_09540 [Desulfovibrio sp.]|jgi:hypothetical protein|nr:hypothetical protein [Desulfovibrio sp.]
MFDDWIAMGLLSQAYNLNAIECIELAQRVPCKFGATSHNRAYDLKKIDHHAKEYARKLMGNSDQSATYSIYHLAMNQWRGETHEQAKATWDAGYKFLWDRKVVKEAFGALWPVTRLFFITDLSVDKKQAVLLLAEAGYPLQKEVKGLTKTVVDGILASANPASAPQPQPLTNSAATPKKRHGAISANDAAKVLKVSERTVRNWDTGNNMPEGYPGRNDLTAFHLFANQYLQKKRLAEQARAMNRASSGLGGLEEFGDYDDRAL